MCAASREPESTPTLAAVASSLMAGSSSSGLTATTPVVFTATACATAKTTDDPSADTTLHNESALEARYYADQSNALESATAHKTVDSADSEVVKLKCEGEEAVVAEHDMLATASKSDADYDDTCASSKRLRLVVECPTLSQPLLVPVARESKVGCVREAVQLRMRSQYDSGVRCPMVLSLSLEESDGRRMLLADDDAVEDVVYEGGLIKLAANLESLVVSADDKASDDTQYHQNLEDQEDDDLAQFAIIESATPPDREPPPRWRPAHGCGIAVKTEPSLRGIVDCVRSGWVYVLLAMPDGIRRRFRKSQLSLADLTPEERTLASGHKVQIRRKRVSRQVDQAANEEEPNLALPRKSYKKKTHRTADLAPLDAPPKKKRRVVTPKEKKIKKIGRRVAAVSANTRLVQASPRRSARQAAEEQEQHVNRTLKRGLKTTKRRGPISDAQWIVERAKRGGKKLPQLCPRGLCYHTRHRHWEAKHSGGVKTLKTLSSLVDYCNSLDEPRPRRL